MFIKCGIVLLGISLLSACVVVPTGPNVMVLPAPGKPFEAFQADEAGCRQYARSQVGIEPVEAANQSAVASGAIGTVAGAAAGALIGAASWEPWGWRSHWSRQWSRAGKCGRRAGQWCLRGDFAVPV